MNAEIYPISRCPSYHPAWFVKGARVESPHHDYLGTVIGFKKTYDHNVEFGVVKTDQGVVITTPMTSDFFEVKR